MTKIQNASFDKLAQLQRETALYKPQKDSQTPFFKAKKAGFISSDTLCYAAALAISFVAFAVALSPPDQAQTDLTERFCSLVEPSSAESKDVWEKMGEYFSTEEYNCLNGKEFTSDALFKLMGDAGKEKAEGFINMFAKSDVDPNIFDEVKQTPLVKAALQGHTEAAYALLKHPKADPNVLDQWGRSSLWVSAERGHKGPFMAFVKDSRVDPNHKDLQGRTPLMIAASLKYEDFMVALIDNAKIKPNDQDGWGNTALFISAWQGLKEGALAILSHPETDPNIQNKAGETALSIAVRKGHIEIVEALLKHPESNPYLRDIRRMNALEYAVLRKDEEMIQLFRTYPGKM